jgi:hypothetical protein
VRTEKCVFLTLYRESIGKIRYGYGFSEHKLHLFSGEFSKDIVPTKFSYSCPPGGRRGRWTTDTATDFIDKELKVKLSCDRIDMTGSGDRP